MTSHALTVLGYLVILITGVSLELVARTGRTTTPTLSELLSRAMRVRSGRVAVMTAWAWLGLHFFAH